MKPAGMDNGISTPPLITRLRPSPANPDLGRRRPDLSDHHLAFNVEQHAVVYTVTGQRINVARILPGRMDFVRHVQH
jgi:plasmid stabilization system protein ParE